MVSRPQQLRLGGLSLNPKVQIAIRQLALAFLDGLRTLEYRATEAWPVSDAKIVASLQKRLSSCYIFKSSLRILHGG